MKLNLLSLNTRGLNNDAAVALLQAHICNSQPILDIVVIQEHKLHGAALSQVGGRLWRHAVAWGLDASPGYGHLPGADGARCGGVLSLLAPRWQRHIGTHGSLMKNRVQWFTLKGIPGGDIGVANIYAPNESPARCILSETMARDLPQTCRWLLVGDFNMVEFRADKTRQAATMILYRERLLFEAMKSTLPVNDNPRTAGSLRYSWDNNRGDDERVLARLDRLYIFPSDPHTLGRKLLTYSIKGDYPRSDHHPLRVTVHFDDIPKRQIHWKISKQWFEAARPEIARI